MSNENGGPGPQGGQPPGGMPPGYGNQPQPPQPHPPGYGPQGQPPQGPPPGYQPPGPPVASAPVPVPEPVPSGRSGIGWKVATGVCALLAVGAFAWGFMQKSDADKAAQANAAALQSAQQQLADSQKQDEELKSELAAAQAAHQKVEAKYKTKARDLKNETAQLKQIENKAQQASAEAAKNDATLKEEVTAARSEAALATKCAQVMATGMQVIYDAPTPEKVMNDVAKEMQRAAESCQGVVTVG